MNGGANASALFGPEALIHYQRFGPGTPQRQQHAQPSAKDESQGAPVTRHDPFVSLHGFPRIG